MEDLSISTASSVLGSQSRDVKTKPVPVNTHWCCRTSSPAVTVTSLPILNPLWSVKDWKALRHVVNLESTRRHANLLQTIWRLFYFDTSVKLWRKSDYLCAATQLFYVHLKLNTGFYVYLHCMRVIMFKNEFLLKCSWNSCLCLNIPPDCGPTFTIKPHRHWSSMLVSMFDWCLFDITPVAI